MGEVGNHKINPGDAKKEKEEREVGRERDKEEQGKTYSFFWVVQKGNAEEAVFS